MAAFPSDNFESYALGNFNGASGGSDWSGNWNATDSDVNIVSSPVHSGSRGIQFDAAPVDAVGRAFSISTNARGSFWIRTTSNSTGGQLWSFNEGGSVFASGALRFAFDLGSNGQIRYYIGAYYDIQAYNANQWYKIEFDFDLSTDDFIYSIDDAADSGRINFNGTATEIDFLESWNHPAAEIIHWDDIADEGVTVDEVTITKSLQYAVTTTPSTPTKSLTYRVTFTPSALTKSLQYLVTASPSITKSLKYTVIVTPSVVTKSLKYTVITTPSVVTKSLKYTVIIIPTALTKSLKYTVQTTPAALTKSLTYKVTSTPTAVTKSLKYIVQSPVAITKSLKYSINKNRFWIGGNGNWNDTAHWSTSSGGSSGASVPTSINDVFIDANSGAPTITNNVNGSCRDFDWTGCGVGSKFTIDGATYALNVYGSLILAANMTWRKPAGSFIPLIYMQSSETDETIAINGASLSGSVRLYFKGSGKWTLQDTFSGDNAARIFVEAGEFDTNGQTVNIFSINVDGGTLSLGSSTLNIGDSTVASFDVSSDVGSTVNAGTSLIKITAGRFDIKKNTTLNNVEFISGTSCRITLGLGDVLTINDLKINAGVELDFEDNETVACTTIDFNGASGNLITLRSSVTDTQWNITVATSSSVSYVDVKDSNASGAGTPIDDKVGGIDSGNNDGWLFPPRIEKSLSYKVVKEYTITKSLKYEVKSTPSALTKSLKYTVQTTPAALTKSLTYKVTSTPTAVTKSLKYEVTASISAITKSLQYLVTANVAPTKSLKYEVTSAQSKTKSLKYTVLTTPTTITKSLTYGIALATSMSKSLKYTIITTPTAVTKGLIYDVLTVSAITKNLQYAVLVTLSITKSLKYEVTSSLSITKSLKYTVIVTPTALTKSLKYMVIVTPTAVTKSLTYAVVITPTALTKSLTYRVTSTPSAVTKSLYYEVTFTPSALTKSLQYLVTATIVAITKSLKYEVTASVAPTKSLKYTVSTQQSETKSLTYIVITQITITKSLTYSVETTPTALTKSLSYEVTITQSVTKSLTYIVTATISSLTKSLKYEVTAEVSITKSLKYTIVVVSAITKSLRYAVTISSALTKSLQYNIVVSSSMTKSLQYQVTSTIQQTKSLQYVVLKDPYSITTGIYEKLANFDTSQKYSRL